MYSKQSKFNKYVSRLGYLIGLIRRAHHKGYAGLEFHYYVSRYREREEEVLVTRVKSDFDKFYGYMGHKDKYSRRVVKLADELSPVKSMKRGIYRELEFGVKQVGKHRVYVRLDTGEEYTEEGLVRSVAELTTSKYYLNSLSMFWFEAVRSFYSLVSWVTVQVKIHLLSKWSAKFYWERPHRWFRLRLLYIVNIFKDYSDYFDYLLLEGNFLNDPVRIISDELNRFDKFNSFLYLYIIPMYHNFLYNMGLVGAWMSLTGKLVNWHYKEVRELDKKWFWRVADASTLYSLGVYSPDGLLEFIPVGEKEKESQFRFRYVLDKENKALLVWYEEYCIALDVKVLSLYEVSLNEELWAPNILQQMYIGGNSTLVLYDWEAFKEDLLRIFRYGILSKSFQGLGLETLQNLVRSIIREDKVDDFPAAYVMCRLVEGGYRLRDTLLGVEIEVRKEVRVVQRSLSVGNWMRCIFKYGFAQFYYILGFVLLLGRPYEELDYDYEIQATLEELRTGIFCIRSPKVAKDLLGLGKRFNEVVRLLELSPDVGRAGLEEELANLKEALGVLPKSVSTVVNSGELLYDSKGYLIYRGEKGEMVGLSKVNWMVSREWWRVLKSELCSTYFLSYGKRLYYRCKCKWMYTREAAVLCDTEGGCTVLGECPKRDFVTRPKFLMGAVGDRSLVVLVVSLMVVGFFQELLYGLLLGFLKVLTKGLKRLEEVGPGTWWGTIYRVDSYSLELLYYFYNLGLVPYYRLRELLLKYWEGRKRRSYNLNKLYYGYDGRLKCSLEGVVNMKGVVYLDEFLLDDQMYDEEDEFEDFGIFDQDDDLLDLDFWWSQLEAWRGHGWEAFEELGGGDHSMDVFEELNLPDEGGLYFSQTDALNLLGIYRMELKNYVKRMCEGSVADKLIMEEFGSEGCQYYLEYLWERFMFGRCGTHESFISSVHTHKVIRSEDTLKRRRDIVEIKKLGILFQWVYSRWLTILSNRHGNIDSSEIGVFFLARMYNQLTKRKHKI